MFLCSFTHSNPGSAEEFNYAIVCDIDSNSYHTASIAQVEKDFVIVQISLFPESLPCCVPELPSSYAVAVLGRRCSRWR